MKRTRIITCTAATLLAGSMTIGMATTAEASAVGGVSTLSRSAPGNPAPTERSLLVGAAALAGTGGQPGRLVTPPTMTTQGWKQKLVVYALRHGGSLLSAIVRRLSPRAGNFLLKNANRLANFLDALENWAEYPIITFLMHNGVPYPEATACAEAVLFFIG